MSRPRPSRITPEVLEREAQVLRLRRAGLTFDMIAQRLEYSHASGAHKAYVNACKRIVHSEVVEVRKEEQDRLDIAQSAIWSNVLKGEIPSVVALLRIMERRAKLLGLDMPVKQEITMYEGGSDIDREVQRLVSLLETNSGGESDMADESSATGATSPED